MSVPTEQQAVIFEANGSPLKFGKIKVGKPAFDEVLININYSGVCHTDLHAWKGRLHDCALAWGLTTDTTR